MRIFIPIHYVKIIVLSFRQFNYLSCFYKISMKNAGKQLATYEIDDSKDTSFKNISILNVPR